MPIATDDALRQCVVWFGDPSEDECLRLAHAGWYVRTVRTHTGPSVGIRRSDFVVAIADLRRPDPELVEAIRELIEGQPALPWLTLLSDESPDFLSEIASLLPASAELFTAPLDMTRLIGALRHLGKEICVPPDADIPGICCFRSPAMSAALCSLRKYAPVDLPVLITGETGSGKELAASAIHKLSPRQAHPFIAINCGSLSPHLVHSELFGHERGAFTGAMARRIGHFEAANHGTVFLDEIGDLPLDAQTNLLRFLQEGTVERVGSTQPIKLNVRVLAATHVDIEGAVASGRFRQDLYYRLNVLRLRIPPLRERQEDIEPLAQLFLDRFRQQHNCRARSFSIDARKSLNAFAWPGNVRELLNRVQRAAVVSDAALISAGDLDLHPTPATQPVLGTARVLADRDAIVDCLRETKFNISECARRLKVSRVTMYRLCKKHHLELEKLQAETSFVA